MKCVVLVKQVELKPSNVRIFFMANFDKYR